MTKENYALKEGTVSVKLRDRFKESTLGAESKFQSERVGILNQTPHPDIIRRDPLYEITLGEYPKKMDVRDLKPGAAEGRFAENAPKSVFNIDLEKYNQMMRVGSRVPGTILKK